MKKAFAILATAFLFVLVLGSTAHADGLPTTGVVQPVNAVTDVVSDTVEQVTETVKMVTAPATKKQDKPKNDPDDDLVKQVVKNVTGNSSASEEEPVVDLDLKVKVGCDFIELSVTNLTTVDVRVDETKVHAGPDGISWNLGTIDAGRIVSKTWKVVTEDEEISANAVVKAAGRTFTESFKTGKCPKQPIVISDPCEAFNTCDVDPVALIPPVTDERLPKTGADLASMLNAALWLIPTGTFVRRISRNKH